MKIESPKPSSRLPSFAQSCITAQDFTPHHKNKKSIQNEYLCKMINRNKTVMGITKTVKKQILDQCKPIQGVLGMDNRL